jgi:hypothetical protein
LDTKEEQKFPCFHKISMGANIRKRNSLGKCTQSLTIALKVDVNND